MGKALRNRVDDAVSAEIFDTTQETFLDEFLMRRIEDRLHLRGVRVFGQGELPLKLEKVRLPLKTVLAIPNLMVNEPIESARERRVEFPVEIGVQALKVVILERPYEPLVEAYVVPRARRFRIASFSSRIGEMHRPEAKTVSYEAVFPFAIEGVLALDAGQHHTPQGFFELGVCPPPWLPAEDPQELVEREV